MKKRKVWRYTCDFCGKSNCHAYHMQNHEKSCTLNPDRICGMCAKSPDIIQVDMGEILTHLPYVGDYNNYDLLAEHIKKNWDSFRKLISYCPACTLAALRQAKIPQSLVCEFWDFKKDCDDFWHEINESGKTEL